MSEATSAAPENEIANLSLNESTASSTAAEANGAAASPSPAASFKESFKAFSKFGDIKSDGKHITLSQSDKWMKQAKVIDKKITTTDTAIHFKKLKTIKVSFVEYQKFLEDLATTKKIELAEIKNKMSNCGAPGVPQLNVYFFYVYYLYSFFLTCFSFSRLAKQQQLLID